MIVLRKRLIFWLAKAYLKRWGKNIIYFFAIGLAVFFVLKFALGSFIAHFPFVEKETIGMVGPYTVDDLPEEILQKISRGLTKSNKDGKITPDIAEKWKIAPNGKGYAIYLKKGVYFSDGTPVTSDNINYDFSDVSILRPDKYTIVFNLKDVYSPFLVTLTRPIFKKGIVGLGEYKVKRIKLNGNFVESIELYSEKLKKAFIYQMLYPTSNSLKTAFVMGETSKIVGLMDVDYQDTSFKDFKNINIEKKTNYDRLVTLFYNTKDSIVSSKTLREGLWYSMPDIFPQGERNPSPLPSFSYANDAGPGYFKQDLEHAKLLIDKANTATDSSKIVLNISTLPKYKVSAEQIAQIWKKLNIDVKVTVVDKIPPTFQIFLGEFNVPLDPDQYTLWHSDQISNITHYSNLRIDKILEDGRKELDIEKRKLLYADFQKYIAADPPASFLFFPYTYEVSRK